MSDDKDERPYCFGKLDTVFPMGEDGLRGSPASCMMCRYKTECLREALEGAEGERVREETVDRAYESGNMGFWERWSRKKMIHNRKKRKGEA